jgi:hypothetical protein
MYIFLIPAILGIIALIIMWWILSNRKKRTWRAYECKAAEYLKKKGYTHIKL